jgi:hypothetical protein
LLDPELIPGAHHGVLAQRVLQILRFHQYDLGWL